MAMKNKNETYSWRNTSQYLMPLEHNQTSEGKYDLYPVHPLSNGEIKVGFDALADIISTKKQVVIDGYGGVFWDNVQEKLDTILKAKGLSINWDNIQEAYKTEDELDEMLAPYLGGDDPVFGKIYEGVLGNFIDNKKLKNIQPTNKLNIVYGCGASLVDWDDTFLIYMDVPKNEIQYRSRAASITNLGKHQSKDPKEMYKRFFFVDWIALNKHKAELLPRIDLLVDEQWREEITFIDGDSFRNALNHISKNAFRVRPWFESGPWGGNWCLKNIPGLNKDVPNYAWSFELITPENGLVFESGGKRLECSFDFLMFQAHDNILGHSASHFKYDFPIRIDYLDTFDGGNLSIQCHPNPEFIRKEFGMTYTQDETYYIMDCQKEANVFIGFAEEVDDKEVLDALKTSHMESKVLDVDRYINSEPSKKHDLFLLPHGTVHSAGSNNLVLEVSATPYIFTFKMYDWLRLGLDGKPRPMNIERASANLDFSRKGKENIQKELIAENQLIESNTNLDVYHLKTHKDMFYDVHRYEFDDEIEIDTNNDVHVMNVVEGSCVLLETKNGVVQRFNYAETFVVPSAAGSFKLINKGNERVKVIDVFMKRNYAYK
jgi:mannose-6-phosphate isomerase class I